MEFAELKVLPKQTYVTGQSQASLPKQYTCTPAYTAAITPAYTAALSLSTTPVYATALSGIRHDTSIGHTWPNSTLPYSSEASATEQSELAHR
jgi:hypothetical protein